MTDRYLNLANRPVTRKLFQSLGMPTPLPLDRFNSDISVVDGPVLVGGTPGSELFHQIAAVMQSIQAQTVAHEDASDWVSVAHQYGLDSDVRDSSQGGSGGCRPKVLLFDATGLSDSTESDLLYKFFHSSVRSLLSCGRVLVLGRPPEGCDNPRQATIQRSLEGLVRSLGKELKHGVTSHLVYVSAGAEANIESTLRFLLSARSAYVSGQVIRVAANVGQVSSPADWNQSLHGKKVLVTGASRGIGLAIARTMKRVGADVIVLDTSQSQSELDKAAKDLGAASITMDISSPEAPEKLVELARADGGWDVIVHNAGITRDKRIANMKLAFWQQVVDINLSSQERINDALLANAALNDNGRIICVSSISGIAGNLGQTNYALSKAGVIGMVQSMASVCANQNVTINAVAPGFIETAMTAAIPFAIREAGRRMNSLNQGGLPVDVAETVAWFASPASGGVNGNVVRVCGQSLLGA